MTNTTVNVSSVIDKVQKLLALAGRTTNIGEATNAAAAANKLIDDYRLSSEDLTDSSSSSVGDELVEDNGYLYETGREIAWKSILASILVKHYGCAAFNAADYSTGRKVSRLKLIGRQSDITIVRYMFNWLSSECLRLSSMNSNGRGGSFTNSYCQGFVAGLNEQLQKSRQEVVQQASCSTNAIVKLDQRVKDSEELMYRNHNNLKKTTTVMRSKNASAYYSGMNQGKNIHLGASMGTGSVKLIGS